MVIVESGCCGERGRGVIYYLFLCVWVWCIFRDQPTDQVLLPFTPKFGVLYTPFVSCWLTGHSQGDILAVGMRYIAHWRCGEVAVLDRLK